MPPFTFDDLDEREFVRKHYIGGGRRSDAWDIVDLITECPPNPLHQRIPGISPLVEEVVMIALAKDPQHRFASVAAFARALEQASELP